MRHHVAVEAFLEGATALVQRGSEDGTCLNCSGAYDLLVAYSRALEEEPGSEKPRRRVPAPASPFTKMED